MNTFGNFSPFAGEAIGKIRWPGRINSGPNPQDIIIFEKDLILSTDTFNLKNFSAWSISLFAILNSFHSYPQFYKI